ncbi:sigma-70 family RNA polymerase sigma factor [Hymenobacter sp. J193]|uniref:RNA polymerase sigma factor n=1 Tax=Hymenobacter sp. J193 TaxID=2898429 RepID=UPI002151A7B9|nr:sigma-70 family RNA polymerase sigma factor [Hymenobacter sp. J193]MCR5890911.1 sigma-70 family RNA polymerase sigma factor [Hymenobacter sp. J193]MCR5890996.1 sigma-70 family RNA polymerase sigma factor [Hymenobacter sp. J193]
MSSLDASLWDDFRTGNEQAFERIFLGYYEDLYGYGMRLSRDEELVKDAIQNLFQRLWQRRAQLGTVAVLKPYLFKALRHQIADELAAEQRRSKLSDDYEAEFQVQYSPEDFLIAQQLSAERQAELLLAINQLNNRQREALHLKFFDGFAYDRIADIMALHPQSVRNLVHQAITRLRQALPPLCLAGLSGQWLFVNKLEIINLLFC